MLKLKLISYVSVRPGWMVEYLILIFKFMGILYLEMTEAGQDVVSVSILMID